MTNESKILSGQASVQPLYALVSTNIKGFAGEVSVEVKNVIRESHLHGLPSTSSLLYHGLISEYEYVAVSNERKMDPASDHILREFTISTVLSEGALLFNNTGWDLLQKCLHRKPTPIENMNIAFFNELLEVLTGTESRLANYPAQEKIRGFFQGSAVPGVYNLTPQQKNQAPSFTPRDQIWGIPSTNSWSSAMDFALREIAQGLNVKRNEVHIQYPNIAGDSCVVTLGNNEQSKAVDVEFRLEPPARRGRAGKATSPLQAGHTPPAGKAPDHTSTHAGVGSSHDPRFSK